MGTAGAAGAVRPYDLISEKRTVEYDDLFGNCSGGTGAESVL
jgi:hypothetical protein